MSIMIVPSFASGQCIHGTAYSRIFYFTGINSHKGEYIVLYSEYNYITETENSYSCRIVCRNVNGTIIHGYNNNFILYKNSWGNKGEFDSQEEYNYYKANENINNYLENNPEFLENIIKWQEIARNTVPIMLPSGKISILSPYLDNLKSIIGDWLKPKVDAFKEGVVDWLGLKVDKFKNSLILGSDLVFNAGSILRLKMAKLFSNPLDDEYIEDENNGVSDELDLVKQLDTFIKRIENTENYEVETYDHETGYRVGYINAPAQYDNETGNYYIDYDIVTDSIPSYRGIYQYESYGVTWDYPNTWHENIEPDLDKGITDTGFYVIGKKSEVEKATGQTFEDYETPEGNYSGFFSEIIELLEDVLLYLKDIKIEIQNLFISGEDENGNPLGFLGILDHLSGLAANIFDFIGTGVGGVGEVISEAVGEAIGNTVGNIRIPTGFLLGLPKFILLIGGVLISLVGIMLRFVVFITTLWNVEPTSELLSVEMIDSIDYVRFMPIPVFGNLYMLTISLITVLAGFMIIKIIRRYEING